VSPFVLLADPKTYDACEWDLKSDGEAGRYWVAFFKRHLETILSLGHAVCLARGEASGSINTRADACRREFNDFFDDLLIHPDDHGRRITILSMDEWRDGLLRKHGFVDAFIDLKNRENEKMLPLLPEVCRRLDLLSGAAQLRAIIEGIFAGNIFDMGAEATAKKFVAEPRFLRHHRQPPEPAVADRRLRTPERSRLHGHAPQSRLLHRQRRERLSARRAADDALARPARDKSRPRRQRAAHAQRHDDPGRRRVVAAYPRNGTELRQPADPARQHRHGRAADRSDESQRRAECRCERCRLLIIEGMGRGVESNLNAAFKVDSLNLAMIKDTMVASRIGGKVFDVVCRFKPGSNA